VLARGAIGRCALIVLLLAAATDAAPETERRVPFVLELRNTTSAVIDSAEVGVFVPVASAVGQRCCRALAASLPFETLSDAAGNQALRLRIERLAPRAVRVVRVTATAVLDPAAGPSRPPDAAGLRAAEPLMQADSVPIRRLAQRLRADSDLATARRTLHWVSDNLRYSGYRRGAAGALAALASGEGDCTEYMHLFIALARANGLPAVPMAGYVLKRAALPSAAGLHNWAEVYADGRWLIADPQRGYLGDAGQRYLATRVLVPSAASAWPADAVRFWVSGSGLEARLR
jgi:transglutaminase-like putative cysteine protease